MKDILMGIFALIVGYISFMSLTFLLGKWFFPLFSEEELRIREELKKRREAFKNRKTLLGAK